MRFRKSSKPRSTRRPHRDGRRRKVASAPCCGARRNKPTPITGGSAPIPARWIGPVRPACALAALVPLQPCPPKDLHGQKLRLLLQQLLRLGAGEWPAFSRIWISKRLSWGIIGTSMVEIPWSTTDGVQSGDRSFSNLSLMGRLVAPRSPMPRIPRTENEKKMPALDTSPRFRYFPVMMRGGERRSISVNSFSWWWFWN